MSLARELSQDLAWYHRLRFPGLAPTPWTRLRVLSDSPGLLTLTAQRLAHHYRLSAAGSIPRRLLRLPFCAAVHLACYLSRVLTKCELLAQTRIEGGVYLSDRGHLIMGASSVGAGTVIHDRVTIGRGALDKGIPEIGPGVWIGPRCVIYGSIKIGAGATLLPGTVLTKSIPARALVQGNPARLLKLDFDNAPLRSSLTREPATPGQGAPTSAGQCGGSARPAPGGDPSRSH